MYINLYVIYLNNVNRKHRKPRKAPLTNHFYQGVVHFTSMPNLLPCVLI